MRIIYIFIIYQNYRPTLALNIVLIWSLSAKPFTQPVISTACHQSFRHQDSNPKVRNISVNVYFVSDLKLGLSCECNYSHLKISHLSHSSLSSPYLRPPWWMLTPKARVWIYIYVLFLILHKQIWYMTARSRQRSCAERFRYLHDYLGETTLFSDTPKAEASILGGGGGQGEQSPPNEILGAPQ